MGDKILGLRTLNKGFTSTDFKEIEDGHLIVKGIVSSIGVPLENKTIYTRELWEKIIEQHKPYMKSRMAYGMLDHPDRDKKDMSTKLLDTYGILLDLEISEDGKYVIGTFEIYANDIGSKLQYLLRKGTVGVSTRGTGLRRKINHKEHGWVEIIENYNLLGIDFVATPSNVISLFTIQEGVIVDSNVEFGYDDFAFEFELPEGTDFSSLLLNESENIVESNKIAPENCIFEQTLKTLGLGPEVFEDVLIGLKKQNKASNNLNAKKTSKKKPEPIIESVSDMVVPKIEITDNMTADEIAKLPVDVLARYIKKQQYDTIANNYERQPNGSLYKAIFIKLINNKCEPNIINDVVTITAEYISKMAKELEDKANIMKQAVEQTKEQYNNNLAQVKNNIEIQKQQIAADINKQVAEAKKEVESLRKTNDDTIEAAKSAIQSKDEETAKAIDAMKEMQLTFAQLLESTDTAVQTSETLIEQIKLLSEENALYQAQIVENNEALEVTNNKLNEVESKLKNVYSLKEKMEQERESFENKLQDYNDLRDNFEKTQEGFEKTIQIIDELQKEKESSLETIEKLTQATENLIKDKQNIEQEKEKIAQELSNIAITHEAISEKLDVIEQEKVAVILENKKLIELHGTLEEEITKTRDKTEDLIISTEKIIKDRDTLKKNNEELKSKLEYTLKNNKELQVKLSLQNEKMKELEERNLVQKNKSEELKNKVENIMKKADTVQKTKTEYAPIKAPKNLDAVYSILENVDVEDKFSPIMENIKKAEEEILENDIFSKKENKKDRKTVHSFTDLGK